MTRAEKRAAKLAAKLAAMSPVDSAVSDLNVGSDIVNAIGNPPDAVSAAPDATPAPRRVPVGNAAHVDPLNVHAVLQFNGATINGIGSVKRRDPLTVTPVALTAADAPALYHRAAVLLALASHASINAPDRIGASPLDRMQFLSRAAERCIFTADRVRDGKRPVRAFSGGYNGTDPTKLRIASVAACSDLPHDGVSLDTLSADLCDPLIVAHLAVRKTATRPDGGYFAVNIGTINR